MQENERFYIKNGSNVVAELELQMVIRNCDNVVI